MHAHIPCLTLANASEQRSLRLRMLAVAPEELVFSGHRPLSTHLQLATKAFLRKVG